jgi:hypothetical protein
MLLLLPPLLLGVAAGLLPRLAFCMLTAVAISMTSTIVAAQRMNETAFYQHALRCSVLATL